MSWRTTALLALAVGVVALIAYRDVVGEDPSAGWEAVFEEPRPTVPADDIERLSDFDPDSVTALSLEYGGAVTRTRRTTTGWSGTATPRVLDEFIVGLSELAIILTVADGPSPEDLTGYGLAEPTARVVLERDRLEPISIELGHRNPSATAIYARVNTRAGVALTGAVALWDLEKTVAALSAGATKPE